MPTIRDIKQTQQYIGRLAHDADLLAELNAIAQQKSITLGRIEALGAVRRAVIGFYDQGTHEYQLHEINRPLEVTNLIGNISLKDGQPIVHAHITLSDESGNAFGGHLCPGTIVFAGEFVATAYEGTALHRGLDAPTGLPLWDLA